MIIDYAALIQGLSDAVFLLDSDGYVHFVNTAAERLTHYSHDELYNNSLTRLYDADGDGVKGDELQQARKSGQFTSEGWRYRKDGSRFWGEIRITYHRSFAGQGRGFVCQLHDLTERKQRELELRNSEEQFRLMVEGVRDYAIFMLDPGGYIKTWNDGAQRTKGYSANEIIGRHFSTFYTAEDLESKKPERELVIAVQTGKYEEEGWRVKKNGSVFWANVVITALFNNQNKLIGFSKVTRDLSERRAAEEHLRQSEERHRLLVEQVTDYGIFMMDEKGRIVSWNEGARRMNGYELPEIIGKYFSIFYPEEDILNGKPSMEPKTARAEGKYEEEGWRIRKDGTRFWASVVITAVYNADNHLIGYSKVTRDLSERKVAEQALRDSYERYRQLAEELRATNTKLSFANEELEQFTSIVSHDLQEPIRTIKSFLQLIDMKLGEKATPELRTYIRKSITAANRMRELIQNLLHYAQLGRDEINEDRVPVSDIFSEALQNLRTSIEAANAQILVETDVEWVRGDAVQLVQVVQNLMSNALKFTSGRQPQIRVRCHREGGTVKFSVSDNGIGIAESDLPKVFEIFRRLHTKQEYPGTGIGLAICKKIVDRHRGRIWPESEPGKGTTFYFTINDQTEAMPA